MSDISPVQTSRVASIDLSRASEARPEGEASGRVSIGEDSVELSEGAVFLNLLARLRDLPEVRSDVVDRAREAYAGDEGVTPDKVDRAIDGLLEDIELFG